MRRSVTGLRVCGSESEPLAVSVKSLLGVTEKVLPALGKALTGAWTTPLRTVKGWKTRLKSGILLDEAVRREGGQLLS